MKKIFTFNHISTDLSEEEIEKFKCLYKNYHRLCTCYRWKFKKMKRIRLYLEMTSIGLTSVGSVAGAITLNPIILGCIAGPGILIQGYLTKTNLPNKVEQRKFAYTTYQKILTQIKAFLRGMPYDETVFLSDVKVIDDIVIDCCPSVTALFDKYHEKFSY